MQNCDHLVSETGKSVPNGRLQHFNQSINTYYYRYMFHTQHHVPFPPHIFSNKKCRLAWVQEACGHKLWYLQLPIVISIEIPGGRFQMKGWNLIRREKVNLIMEFSQII